MEDTRINIRATLNVDNLEQNAAKYRKELANLGTVTDKEGRVISTAWERVGNAAKKSNVGRVIQEMTGDVSENIAIQKKVLTDLEEQYKQVAKAIENTAPGMAKNKLLSEMAAIKQEIDGEKQAFTELEQVQNQYNQSNVSLRTQLINVRNEMEQLELSGQKNSERYKELEEELGRSGAAYRKLEYEQKAFSTGMTQWSGIISGIQGVASAFAAAQGTIGLFVSDNEKLAKIQSRLQAVMAITIEMQQVSNTFHETSAFRMTTVRRVTELYTAAQTKLATSLGVSATMAKVLMASLTFGLSAVITGLIALISKLSSAQKKAAEEQKHIIEVQKKAAESAGEQRATYEKLANEWNNLGDDLEAKKKFIEANKSEFEKLGLSIDKVNDAENLFTKNKEAFILSLDQRAKAMAAMELAMEKYKEAYRKQEELKTTSKTKKQKIYTPAAGFGGMGTSQTFEVANEEYNKLETEIKKLNADASSFIKNQSDAMKEYYETLEKAGLKTSEEAERLKKEREEAERKANELKKQAEQEKKLREQINNELISLQKQNQQDQIDLMEEGTEKQLAQIRLDYQKKIEEIKKLADRWASAQGGTLTAEQTIQISTAYSGAKKGKDTAISNITVKQIEDERKAWQEYIKEYGTYEEKKLIITNQYAEKIAKASNSGEKALLQKQQEKELDDLNQSMIEQTSLWTRLFSDANNHTNKYISETIAQTEELVNYLNESKGAKLPNWISEEQIEALKKNPEKVKAILEQLKKQKDELNTRNPFGALIDGFKDLSNAASDTEKQIAAINKIIAAMNGASAIIGQVGDALDSMGLKAGGAAKEVADVIGQTASMASAGASIGGPIGAAVGAGLGLATSIIKLFSGKKDKKHDNQIAAIQKEIEKLDKEYAKLQEKTASSYSGRKAASIQEESKNLEKQNQLIQQQIAEEQAKKKTDQSKIDEWNNAIEANREQNEKNKALVVDAISGSDIQSAIDDFSAAYADAWAAGDDRAIASKDLIKKMIKQMIMEAMKMDIEAPLQRLREQMVNFYQDGIIDAFEQSQLESIAEGISHDLDKKYGWADRFMKGEEIDSSVNTQTGAISETITEQTASEMTGIWRGSYDTLKGIYNVNTSFYESYKSTMFICNVILNRIADNTGLTANNTSVLSEMNQTMNRMDGRLKTLENKANQKFI